MRTRLLRLSVVTTLLVGALGGSAFGQTPELVPADRQFFLRGSGCGTTEAFWLSVESGPDEYDGCGGMYGLPFSEIFYQFDGPSPDSFSTQDGVPVILDASRDVAGQIRAESWFQDSTPAAGQVVVDVALHAVDVDGVTVTIGSTTEERLVTDSSGVNIPFTLDVRSALDQRELSNLTLDVSVHGANFNNSNLGLEGDSRFTLPILEPAE